MNIAQAIMHLYPNADPARDFIVTDDGTGQRIEHWGIDAPPPEPDELAAAWGAFQASPPPKPTKAELLAKLDDIMAQVQALAD